MYSIRYRAGWGRRLALVTVAALTMTACDVDLTEVDLSPDEADESTTTDAPEPARGVGDEPATDEAVDGAPDESDDMGDLDTDPSDGELLPLYTPRPGCAEGDVVPSGQASGARNFEPLGSIWCFDLAEPSGPTAVEGPNSWVDDFTVDTPLLRFDDGDFGYRVFDEAGPRPGTSQHWVNQNHWMVDNKGAINGGASMRPDRSFRFEDGKLIVEGDFAASIPEYSDEGGSHAWGEITITSAPAPTGETADNLYAYGQFGGHWAVGCRLQADHPICAVIGAEADDPPGNETCSAIPGRYRVIEISFFQHCGTTTMGGADGPETRRRRCERGGLDMACRDRYRMEVTKDSITLYINGQKYMEDAGWPAAHQLPDSFINGDVYVYQSNWQWDGDPNEAYRYHWDHFAVNPPNGPEPSEWYGR